MIDLKTEALLSLPQAARIVPPTRLDKKVHVSTLVRWILHGVRGVHIDALRVGGRWVTSREAIDRFSAALTTAHYTSPIQSDTPRRSSAAQQRRHDQVERRLRELGF